MRVQAVDPDTASPRARLLLEAAARQPGQVPQLARLMAHSPAVLGGVLTLGGALGLTLDPALRARLALAVAEVLGCASCREAHAAAARAAGLREPDILAARRGRATRPSPDDALRLARARVVGLGPADVLEVDPRADAALRLALELLERHGRATDETLERARAAGLSDLDLVEVAANVALHTLAGYLDGVARPDGAPAALAAAPAPSGGP